MEQKQPCLRVYSEMYIDEKNQIPEGVYKTNKKNYTWKVYNVDGYYYCHVWKGNHSIGSLEKKNSTPLPINIKINNFNQALPTDYPQPSAEHVYPYGSILSSVHLPNSLDLRWFSIYATDGVLKTINQITAQALDFQVYNDSLIWGIFQAFYCGINLPEGLPIFDCNGETLLGFVGGRLSNNMYAALTTPIDLFFHPVDANDIMINIQLWEGLSKINVYGNNFNSLAPKSYLDKMTNNDVKKLSSSGGLIKRLNFILFSKFLIVTGTDKSDNDEILAQSGIGGATVGEENQLFYMKMSFQPTCPIFTYKRLVHLEEEITQPTTPNKTNAASTAAGKQKKKSGIRWFFKRESIVPEILSTSATTTTAAVTGSTPSGITINGGSVGGIDGVGLAISSNKDSTNL